MMLGIVTYNLWIVLLSFEPFFSVCIVVYLNLFNFEAQMSILHQMDFVSVR